MNRLGWFALLISAPVFAARIPSGTELSIRLTDKAASEVQAQASIHAVLIAPVIVNGTVAVSAGAQLTGTVKQAKAATEKDPAQLQLEFTELRDGAEHSMVSGVVAGLDNARETIDDKGVITGIAPDQTFSARIDQGIAKLGSNDKLAGLAGLISGAKQVLKIQDANPNIDYDAGAEFTLRLTQPLEWRGADRGPTSKLQTFPNEASLGDLVNRQPFRTVAENPPRPSDITNLMFIATEAELLAAFEKAGWAAPSRLNTQSKLETARALIEARGYKEGPMSILLLDGRTPDMAFQKGNNTFAQRHHLRIFRRPGTFDGKPVWVCSSTHDIGIDFSDRDRTFIHKIDPEIDLERAKVVNDLLFTGMVRSIALVERPGIPQNATNATGDSLRTDGSMAVLLLQ
ncbi:MAG TPA: LssY C-terminal domain-containing protein [Bryobacteraceae bacterium]|nr:LssY C-terminal domain-containing protein [Bryobacteraceae bacterium]